MRPYLDKGDFRQRVERCLPERLTDEEWSSYDNKFRLSLEHSCGRLPPEEAAQKIFADVFRERHQSIQFLRTRRTSSWPIQVEALSALLHYVASNDPSVVAFRQEVLHNKLLEPEEAIAWIHEQEKGDRQGDGTLKAILVTVAVPPSQVLLRDDGFEYLQPGPERRILSTEVPRLRFGHPRGRPARSRPVSAGGLLDRLRCLSERLADDYGWQPAQATMFILCDLVPLVGPWRIGGFVKLPLRVLSRIELSVSPAISARQLSQIYAEKRRRMLVGRPKSISPKHAELVLFWLSRPKGEASRRSMEDWNRKFPRWRYKHLSNFDRDIQEAKERLLQLPVLVESSARVLTDQP